jgi:hypothetical protein
MRKTRVKALRKSFILTNKRLPTKTEFRRIKKNYVSYPQIRLDK